MLVTRPHDKIDSAAHLLRANPRSHRLHAHPAGRHRLAAGLTKRGIRTVDLHGSLSQNARERNLRKFKTGQADVIVATDVAARGIHVDGISLVVHYDAPTEQKAYLHRSGRTARAGNSGTVVTMTTERGVHDITRLHRSAGVSARHHDTRTAPSPMTPASLATAGTDAPESPRCAASSRGEIARSRQRAAQVRQAVGRDHPRGRRVRLVVAADRPDPRQGGEPRTLRKAAIRATSTGTRGAAAFSSGASNAGPRQTSEPGRAADAHRFTVGDYG